MKEELLVLDLQQDAMLLLIDHPEWYNLELEDDVDYISQQNTTIVIKSLRWPVYAFIDESTLHSEKISIRHTDLMTYLTEDGLKAYDDEVVANYITKTLDAVDEFTMDSEWNLYRTRLIGNSLFIRKGADWRAMEYERIISQSKENDD
jgi:hypothetical protein